MHVWLQEAGAHAPYSTGGQWVRGSERYDRRTGKHAGPRAPLHRAEVTAPLPHAHLKSLETKRESLLYRALLPTLHVMAPEMEGWQSPFIIPGTLQRAAAGASRHAPASRQASRESLQGVLGGGGSSSSSMCGCSAHNTPPATSCASCKLGGMTPRALLPHITSRHSSPMGPVPAAPGGHVAQ
jgi:hypothetical protein